MKKCILISIVVLFAGCMGRDDSGNKIGIDSRIYVAVKDDCEYIIYDGYRAGGIVHKENCRYCEARSRAISVIPVQTDSTIYFHIPRK